MMDGSVRALCFLQLAAAVILVGYIIVYLPTALEWGRLAEETSPSYEKTIAMIRDQGVTGERKELIAQLLESLVGRLALQPKMFQSTFGAAAALAVLFSILPTVLLWRHRKRQK